MEAKKEFNPTPGPWEVNNEDAGMNDSGTILDGIGHVIVTDVYGIGKQQAHDNATLIAAAPTMYRKLKNTVEWLEIEIEYLRESTGPYGRMISDRLEELRDDLAEVVKRIEEG